MTSDGSRREERSSARVRTYSARRGRLSALTLQRLARLGPARLVAEGPLDLAAIFGRTAPLVLEVGCGHGAAAIAYAQAHPEHDVLAVDVHTPGVARMLAAADTADTAGVPNLKVVLGDAVEVLDGWLPAGRVAALHLFFPDPWPKNKHAKRRFVSADTLTILDALLAPGGFVRVATDQDAYAAHVRSEVAAHEVFVARDVERPGWRPVDGFEAKGLAAGHAITDLRLERRR